MEIWKHRRVFASDMQLEPLRQKSSTDTEHCAVRALWCYSDLYFDFKVYFHR